MCFLYGIRNNFSQTPLGGTRTPSSPKICNQQYIEFGYSLCNNFKIVGAVVVFPLEAKNN